MPDVIVQKWEESERGWGTRPDGYSLHRTEEDRVAYLRDATAAERARNPSGVTPDEYSRPFGDPYVTRVDDDTYAKIRASKNGIRCSGTIPSGWRPDAWRPATPSRRTWMGRTLAGEFVDIVQEMQAWGSLKNTTDVGLHDWLGMTEEELTCTCEDVRHLPAIVARRFLRSSQTPLQVPPKIMFAGATLSGDTLVKNSSGQIVRADKILIGDSASLEVSLTYHFLGKRVM